MTKELCPCRSKKQFQYCCGMYLSGKKKPDTAEKLMRSRYTAFVKGNVDYLMATVDPELRKPSDFEQLTTSISNTQWLGLTIVSTQKGKKQDATGWVEFEAVYRVTEPAQLHERSRFRKIDGQWFYIDGDILPGTIPKSNQPCWCGSGKKYKDCHKNL